MHVMRVALVALLFPLAQGCSRSTEASDAKPLASASAAAPPAALVASAAKPSAPASNDWTGHYDAVPGSLYVPDGGEWAGVRFRGEDASAGLGEGPMSLTVDPTGRVAGTLGGPLGALSVDGELAAESFRGALVSSGGEGFEGTAAGRVEKDRLTGTMRLSSPTGSVVREAHFVLERKH